MKKFLTLVLLVLPAFLFAQHYTGSQAARHIDGAIEVRLSDEFSTPEYIKFSKGNEIPIEDFSLWASKAINLGEGFSFEELNRHGDRNGYKHIRYQLNYNKIPIHSAIIILHTKNGLIESLNGFIPKQMGIINSFDLNEEIARNSALSFVNAERYKWELPEEELFIKQFNNNPNASFYPEGEKVILPVKHQGEPSFAYAYQFDIYAHQPVYRADIFVDAASGEILLEDKTIHHIDTGGTAMTKYSGSRDITTDYFNSQFRLRESGRGNGIETYDMNNGTSYGAAVDFTDADNYWNNYNAQIDEVATDAHWAAEVTYDYFLNKHSRNSIDNNGLKLISYVHYDVNYVNAFWNGQYMTFGDGNGSTLTPLTTLDIVGHEITHGLTSYTANLIYQDESGALNEGFSDIFAAAIEAYGRPNNHNWNIGEDIGATFRSMSNPNAYQLPDTYYGNYWYTGTNDNGGVHTNMGPLTYWYYLLVEGGSGTNDNNDSYQVNGIGMDSAAAIAYRMLTVYLTPSSEYDDARFYAIKSAVDLYGPCSQAVQSVTNGMYAIGVGNPYIPGVQADFSAGITTFCQAPATVKFSNQSNNGINFTWDFGDGTSSTAINPSHTYTQYGDFTVKLIADGGTCGIDSIIDTALVSINSNNPCNTIIPLSGNQTVNGCSGILFDDGGPNGNYSDNSMSSVTIAPQGASSLTLTFTSFDFESGYDYLKIYDGTSSSGTLIGSFDGNSLPNGGTINSSTGALFIQQVTDQYVNESGFSASWTCSYPNMPPSLDFSVSDTFSCDGVVYFNDLSSNGPTNWIWDFGDGNTSNIQNPVHQYTQNGVYNIRLKASNAFGSDSLLKQAFIKVEMPSPISGDTLYYCSNNIPVLNVSANGIIHWYSDSLLTNLLDTGATYTPGSGSKTIYAANQIMRPGIQAGKADNSGGGGYFSAPYEHFLVFDAYRDIKIKSVKVYAGSQGNREITLRDANGTVLHSKNINIPQGESRIELNFMIPVGSDYELSGPLSPDLYRNNSGTAYPYKIDGLVSVNYSSANSDPTGYYYYFYDWDVVPVACQSNSAAFKLNAYNNSPVADFDFQKNKSNVTFNDLSTEAQTYLWKFGDGSTSNQPQPVHYYTDLGYYDVTLITHNPCGSDSITKTVEIIEVGIDNIESSEIVIYPNPSNDWIRIDFGNNEHITEWRLFDASGKIIYQQQVKTASNESRIIQVDQLNSGVYYLQIIMKNTILRKKVLVI